MGAQFPYLVLNKLNNPEARLYKLSLSIGNSNLFLDDNDL